MTGTRTRTTAEGLDDLLDAHPLIHNFDGFVRFADDGDDFPSFKIFVEVGQCDDSVVLAGADQTVRDFLQRWAHLGLVVEHPVLWSDPMPDSVRASWSAWRMRADDHVQPDSGLVQAKRMARMLVAAIPAGTTPRPTPFRREA